MLKLAAVVLVVQSFVSLGLRLHLFVACRDQGLYSGPASPNSVLASAAGVQRVFPDLCVCVCARARARARVCVLSVWSLE